MATCEVCTKKIRGRVYYWNHRPRCKKCYSYFCKKVSLKAKPSVPNRPKPAKVPNRPKSPSLWKRLFG